MTASPVAKDAYGRDAQTAARRQRLYIIGATPHPARAIENITVIGKTHLSSRFDLEVIDAYEPPELIRNEQIVVLPTLIRQLPLPIRRMVGDFSDEDRVPVGLGHVLKHQGGGY